MEMLVIAPQPMSKAKHNQMMSMGPMSPMQPMAPMSMSPMSMSPMMPMKEYKSKMNGMSMNMYGQGQQNDQPIRAAVKSRHMVDFMDVPSEPANVKPQTILVEANNIPLNILFQSRSSELNLHNEHTPSKGSVQETMSEDEPHRLIHKVTKPIFQEVFEIIKPYRKITQEITPVEEEIQTIVARSLQDSKYVPVNNQFKGKNNMNMNMMHMDMHDMNGMSGMGPMSGIGMYGMNGMMAGRGMGMLKMNPMNHMQQSYESGEQDVVAKMIQAIKMKEMNKKYGMRTQPMMGGYQPMNGAGRGMPPSMFTAYGMDQMEKKMPEQQQNEMEPMMKMMEKPMSVMTDAEEMRQEQGQDMESPKGMSKEEKSMQSLMVYSGGDAQMIQMDQQPPTKSGKSAMNFGQKNNYAESNTEPTGY